MSTQPLPITDARTVLAVLSQTTADLREAMPAAENSAIRSMTDARAAVAALLEQEGINLALDPDRIFPDEEANTGAARQVLQVLWTDPRTQTVVEDALAQPPSDTQKSVELAMAGAVVLGALITWLQTVVEIKIARKEGKLDFEFKLKKESTDKSTLSEVAKTVASLVTG
jgi:hypothetical protein